MTLLRKWAWKDGWTEGRAVGFIPYSWFHKEESALLNAPKDILFFQNFGFHDRSKWCSLQEPGVEPPTPAEVYDARCFRGRFAALAYTDNPFLTLERERVLNRTVESTAPDNWITVKQQELPERPSWNTTSSDDAAGIRKDAQRRKDAQERRKLIAEVPRLCVRCRIGRPLFLEGRAEEMGEEKRYVHASGKTSSPCKAEWNHWDLRTKTPSADDVSPLPVNPRNHYWNNTGGL